MAQKKTDMLTFEQWQNVIQNPPKSWTDYNMNWDDPNPQSSVYWIALVEALKQRYSVVRTTRDRYPFGNTAHADYAYSFKYNSAIQQREIYRLCFALFSVADRFIDPNKTNYQNLLRKYNIWNVYSEEEDYFPSIIGYGAIMQKYPAIARFASSNINSLSMSVYYLKDFLKQFKSAIGDLQYTKGGEVSSNWVDNQSYSVDGRDMQYYPNGMWDDHRYISTLSDIKKAMKSRQDEISNWNPNTSSSYFEQDSNDSNSDFQGGWIGMQGSENRKDSYSGKLYYSWGLQVSPCKVFKHFVVNPLNLTGTVYAFIYTGDIDLKDKIIEDDYQQDGVKYDTGHRYTIINDYCGFNKGMNIKQLGAATNELKTYTILEQNKFPWLWVTDLPGGYYGPQSTPANPLIYNNVVKGCCMLCSIVVKYNFKFS